MEQPPKKRTYTKITKKALDKPINRKRMLDRIRATGKEKDCWRGICKTVRTYYRFKKANADWWPNEVDRAIQDFYNVHQLLDPKFTRLLHQQIVTRVAEGKASISDMLKIHAHLAELRDQHLPG